VLAATHTPVSTAVDSQETSSITSSIHLCTILSLHCCVLSSCRCVFQWRHEVEAESGASLGGSTVGTALSASSGKRDSFDEDPLDPLMFNSDAGGGDM
jgi:hypothetical protein